MGFWLTLVLVLMVGVEAASGQKIMVIKSREIAPYAQALGGFHAMCGQSADTYDLEGSTARRTDMLKHIESSRPSLILAVGPLAAQMVSDNVSDIPIVFVMVANPSKYQLAGNHIVGISLDIPIEKQFDIYRSLAPSLQTLGVLYDPDKTASLVRRAQAVAVKQGIQLLAIPLHSSKDVPTAFRSLLGKIDALWMLPDNTVITKESFKFLLLKTIEHRLPFLAISNIFVKAGALAALSPNYTDMGRQACQLARTVMAGTREFAQFGVIPPSDIQLAINLKTAKKIGLTLPQAIIKSANQVFR